MKKLHNIKSVIFENGGFSYANKLVAERKKVKKGAAVYLIDHFFKEKDLIKKINLMSGDQIIYLDTSHEPTTWGVDSIVKQIQTTNLHSDISVIVGMGGGSTLDTAKAISVLLTNSGKSESFQGYNLIKKPGIYKIGIPTISGTGSEVSQIAVLTSKKQKRGINSEFCLFDEIILDPRLSSTVDKHQMFFTAMDCYIHCVESLAGTYINTLSKNYAEKAKEICERFFLERQGGAQELMVASMFGGISISYSEVGLCHALSYGLSLVLGLRHGIANCVVFNVLDNYYPEEVSNFKKMLIQNNITLPKSVCGSIKYKNIKKMVDMTLRMEKPLENYFGKNWKNTFTREKIIALYKKM
jgi:3-deoxy-alpha-D-manno-octulosonate 8-oxidase